MKVMNKANLRTVDAGATATYGVCCRYCGYEAWSNYNNAWWCRAASMAIAKRIVENTLTVHYRNCTKKHYGI